MTTPNNTPTEHTGMMLAALAAAHPHLGQASPNPPVGAAGFTADGTLLGAFAHTQAGQPHAESLVIQHCRKNGTDRKSVV